MSAHPPSSRRQQQLPEEGSIQEGKVVRVEPYGAFVELNNFYRVRGLVHISQLAGYKVDQVTDVVSVDDGVWVKVLEVTSETTDDGRTRTKVSLSLKDASQEDGRDLGEQREQSNALTQQISRNLHSSIGMGFAQDPMANNNSSSQRSASRLVLKNQPKQETVINGYALVDDFEGEPDVPAASEVPAPTASAAAPAATLAKAPMGRGRGSTLPAWMTRADGPTKQLERTGDEERSTSSSTSRSKKKRKHKDREKKSRHKEDRHRRHKHKHKHKHSRKDERKHRKRERDSSRSRSRSPSPSRKSSRKSSRRHGDSDDSSENQHSRGKTGFTSVEEAQRLIQQLEAKKKKENDVQH